MVNIYNLPIGFSIPNHTVYIQEWKISWAILVEVKSIDNVSKSFIVDECVRISIKPES